MTLDLAFRAETEDDARAQAVAWGAAERHVVGLVVDRIVRTDFAESTCYVVTVTITFIGTAQGRLGL
jgi:hypothetical protein